ncbi:HDOD domain-containing protein [Rehaibacterium terrae]|uniref:HD-like signal output (HDOD) protein n=1 Tax=Rehaibacterium terrae TaxID=1341696 RepID=A0A7W7Y281_9GAMM|nr:HD-like signal output (HDOD) protein [Rehaibacterium terrae]
MFVLIVSSNPATHAELNQTLSEFGLDWDTEQAQDAVTALAIAMDRPVDVAVAELRGPGFDGAGLLAQIRSHHPEAARLLLLEEGEEPAAMMSMDSAHRFLNKPLRAEELVDAVESVAELRELLDSPELKAAVGRVGNLPPPPKLYLELSRALESEDTTPSTLSNLISQDPVVAAKVLRMCNSAYFSGGRTVTDIRSAVIRLGQQTLRRLVLASEVFSQSIPGNIDREAMQQRALLSSQLAARLLGGSSSELAATAALLADVGMLLPGVRIPAACAAGELDKCSGPHYAEAGAYLLGLWGLPMPIVEAVASHHQPGRSRFRGFWVGGAVHVARALVSGEAVDEKYLESVGLRERLPAWRKMADDLLAAEAA